MGLPDTHVRENTKLNLKWNVMNYRLVYSVIAQGVQ